MEILKGADKKMIKKVLKFNNEKEFDIFREFLEESVSIIQEEKKNGINKEKYLTQNVLKQTLKNL